MNLPRTGLFLTAAVGLISCVAERSSLAGAQTPSDSAPVNALSIATADRARAESAAGMARALGSFYRRVWTQEFERLITPMRAGPLSASVPEELNGSAVSAWQASLDQGWKTEDPDTAIAAAQGVREAAARNREALEQLLNNNPNLSAADPSAYSSALAVRGIIHELVLEADLLLLRDSGAITAFEDFVTRYPDGPYTASVLFALGALLENRRELADAKAAFTRLIERFPSHPLAEQARRRVEAL